MNPTLRSTVDFIEARFTGALVVTTVAIYALLVTGATASLLEAGSACSTWPSCEGAWLVLDDPSLAVAMAHRVVSLVVGLCLIGLVIGAWLTAVPSPVNYLLTGVLVLYPVQIATGAMTAVFGTSAVLSAVHLLVAMAIFAGVMLALLVYLEYETRDVISRFEVAEPPAQPSEVVSDRTIARRLRAYVELTKPRLMWLLCVVAIAGMGLATAATSLPLTVDIVVGTLVGGVLAIGASGTFNHILERDIDRRMARTADRPIATHVIPARNALVFGIGLAIASIAVFVWLTTPLAAGLGLVAIAFYSVVYTLLLKPHTTQNIVIGGAVGALPALIGWAAVTGSIGLPAIVLGVIVFLWTPAHFYNLALVYRSDYERGGFPMLPVVRGERITRRHIGYYLAATMLAVAGLGAVADLGILYATTVIVFAGVFLVAIVKLHREQTRRAALRAFHTSNAFLGVVMLVVTVETLVF